MHTRMDGIASAGTERDRRVRYVALHQARVTSTGVSLKHAPSARSALICGDQSRDCLPGAARR
jgi:hypothetical protein